MVLPFVMKMHRTHRMSLTIDKSCTLWRFHRADAVLMTEDTSAVCQLSSYILRVVVWHHNCILQQLIILLLSTQSNRCGNMCIKTYPFFFFFLIKKNGGWRWTRSKNKQAVMWSITKSRDKPVVGDRPGVKTNTRSCGALLRAETNL